MENTKHNLRFFIAALLFTAKFYGASAQNRLPEQIKDTVVYRWFYIENADNCWQVKSKRPIPNYSSSDNDGKEMKDTGEERTMIGYDFVNPEDIFDEFIDGDSSPIYYRKRRDDVYTKKNQSVDDVYETILFHD
jgi:hypothetical protein